MSTSVKCLMSTAALLFCSTAFAHHGWSGNSEPLTLTGKVVSNVSLSGPHASMQVEDAEGQVWDITLAPAPRTHRAGLTEDVLPLGAEVTLEGQRNDNPSRYEIKTRKVSWNERVFAVYPD